MTEITNSTVTSATKRAELAALSAEGIPFDWIIEDFDDDERIINDTHAAAVDAIEELRRERAGELDPWCVTFHLLNGEAWARIDLRSEARRRAA